MKTQLDIELKVNGDEVVGELSVEPTLIESTPKIANGNFDSAKTRKAQLGISKTLITS